ncbi:MAG: ice-binding family protein [Acidiferrobacter sp.]
MYKIQHFSKRIPYGMALILAIALSGCKNGGEGQAPILAPPSPIVLGVPSNSIVPGAICSASSGPNIPAVTVSDPTNGNNAATTSTTGIAGGGKVVTATFNMPMNPATITAASFRIAVAGGTTLTPMSVTYNTSTYVATLTTTSALLPGTSYTVVIANSVTSNSDVALGCGYAWSFKTVTPAATGLAQVQLGIVAPYGIAAAAGVTNTPTSPMSNINGNAVLDPTATCNSVAAPGGAGTGGFGTCPSSSGANAAPTINGTVITPTYPDTTTANSVMAALTSVYNSITPANLPGATVLGCGTIGTGGGAGAGIGCAGNATLPPGVYTSATGSSIGVTGTLTLDGQGDTNSVFVFQAPSTLVTASGGSSAAPASQIVLINGAKASNVFWQVGSSATIGTYSIFEGNILANASITMDPSSTSCGRLLAGAVATSGAFTFNTSDVSVPGNSYAPASCQ